MIVLDVLTAVLLALGCLVALTSAVGVLRMPDVFSRLHPAGKSDTLAQMLVVLALLPQAFAAGEPVVAAKLVFVTIFLLVTTPVSAHALARAAYLSGRRPWERPVGAGAGEIADAAALAGSASAAPSPAAESAVSPGATPAAEAGPDAGPGPAGDPPSGAAPAGPGPSQQEPAASGPDAQPTAGEDVPPSSGGGTR